MDRRSSSHKRLCRHLALFQFNQRNIEFHPSSPFSMHWPPLTTRFLTNAFAFVTPSHVFPISGGGGGRGGGGSEAAGEAGEHQVLSATPPHPAHIILQSVPTLQIQLLGPAVVQDFVRSSSAKPLQHQGC